MKNMKWVFAAAVMTVTLVMAGCPGPDDPVILTPEISIGEITGILRVGQVGTMEIAVTGIHLGVSGTVDFSAPRVVTGLPSGITASGIFTIAADGSGSGTLALSGTPAATGTSDIDVSFRSISAEFSITVAPASVLEIGTITGNFIVGEDNSVTAAVSGTYLGDAGTVNFADTEVVTGLPSGITASGIFTIAEDGSGSGTLTLSGVPVADGPSTVTVTVRGVSENVSIDVIHAPLITIGAITGTLRIGQTGAANVIVTGVHLGDAGTVDFSGAGVVAGLPSGVAASGMFTIAANGTGGGMLILSGTPAAMGTSGITVMIRDASDSFQITVAPASVLTIGTITGSLIANQAGTVTVAVSGANLGAAGSVDFAADGVVTGLPSGITASGTFTIAENEAGSGTLTLSGIPVADGPSTVTVTMRGVSDNFQLAVAAAPVSVLTIGTITGNFIAGQAGTVTVAVSGANLGVAGSVDFAADDVVTGLPSGITASGIFTIAEDGSGSGTLTLSGTPVADGPSTVTVTVRGVSDNFQLAVAAAPVSVLTIGTIAGNFIAGQAGTVTVVVSGANLGAAGSVDFAADGVVTGLPSGITASGTFTIAENEAGSGTLTLSGTPVADGPSTVTVIVRGVSDNFQLAVAAAAAPLINVGPPNAAITSGTVGFISVPITVQNIAGLAGQTVQFQAEVNVFYIPEHITVAGSIQLDSYGNGADNIVLIAMTAVSDIGNHEIQVVLGSATGTFTLVVNPPGSSP